MQRCYKTSVALLKLFPGLRTPQEESVFDKVYLTQLIMLALSGNELAAHAGHAQRE